MKCVLLCANITQIRNWNGKGFRNDLYAVQQFYRGKKCLNGKQFQKAYLSQETTITTLITNVRKERKNENRRTSAEH